MTDTPTATLTVNGQRLTVAADHPHLLAALREELDLTAAKDGCAPAGQCGACTVIVDGTARLACKTPPAWAGTREVTTLEGLPDGERQRIAAAFADAGAAQCGFCIPGIVMRVKPLLDRPRVPTRTEIARHLRGNLCRCTGYVKIIDAVQTLTAGQPPAESVSAVGSRSRRYRAEDLVLGEHQYIDDLRVPEMLHAALRLTEHARAHILGIDTTAAAALPGVAAVYTAADVPGQLRVGLIGADWPIMIPERGITSYAGDVLAVVVADDKATAERAADLVAVSYEVMTPVVDPQQALASSEETVWMTGGNILHQTGYRRGDTDTALAASAHVATATFTTQRVEHAFLEPEATLALPTPDGGIHVYSGGQGIFDDRRQIADVLDLAPDRITVSSVSPGGAFGGKEDMSNQAHTALAALLTGRPVKCVLTREQSLLMHPKRHPFQMTFTAGTDNNGKLTALHARFLTDSGAYGSVGLAVLEWTVGHATGPYVIPNVDVHGVAARTNNPVCGAFRGFGAVQAQFAMEGIMDRLAAANGIDPWEIRRRNLMHPGATWGPGQIVGEDAASAQRCLDAIRPHLQTAQAAGKAVGFGLIVKNSGLGDGYLTTSHASVYLHDDGRVDVAHSFTEMGQGVDTVAAQVTAAELDVDLRMVTIVSDTALELPAGQTTGSRTALAVAGAVRDACREAIQHGRAAGVTYRASYDIDADLPTFADQPVGTVLGRTFCFAAQLAVVDRATGRIEKMIAVHDVGRAINPTLCEGQIEGAVHMGLGYALSEDFPTGPDGKPTRLNLRDLGIISAADMPPVQVELIEQPQPDAPFGIKGVGEMGLIATPAAIAAMLHDLDGTWRDTLPLQPGH
ncbi:molybdopterin cofactor-binding domain-containing protein [Actinoplanes sp. NPDC051475]|uniref:molybdopterin cofactor-binding domain-containing protein n=1 Tax=Actinoplanes sp. NPDC051475 TaxID=3157225 RepID=UPI00344C9449